MIDKEQEANDARMARRKRPICEDCGQRVDYWGGKRTRCGYCNKLICKHCFSETFDRFGTRNLKHALFVKPFSRVNSKDGGLKVTFSDGARAVPP